jgi:cytochrome o ubiquinol oxidase operon protein cyoD
MSNYHEVANTQHGTRPDTLKYSMVGFILSLLITIGSFILIEQQLLSDKYLYISLAVLALLQLIVQVLCFLRLNTSSDEARWDLMSFLFTIFITVVVVGGSLWIMYNLNYNMMH